VPTSGFYLNYYQLLSKVSYYLGYGTWDAFAHNDVLDCVDSGLRQFYWPPPLEKGDPHRWSFLETVSDITTTAGSGKYTLPDNFGGIIGDLTYPVKAQPGAPTVQRISTITELQLRAAQTNTPEQGPPLYAAIRPSTSDSQSTQSWELLLHPIPDSAYKLTFAFNLIPESLGTANQTLYPLGGAVHSETILESCLAIAERRVDDAEEKKDIHQQQFLALLAQSIKIDKSISEPSATSPWPIVPDSGLVLGYRQLLREVGKMLEFGWDSSIYAHEQFSIADEVVQQGLRQFYGPPLLPGRSIAHEWTFLRPEAELKVEGGIDTYDLPENCASIYGDLHYVDATVGIATIKVCPIGQIRKLQALPEPICGRPFHAAVVPSSADGKSPIGFQIVFFPNPDGCYTFRYQYKLIPPRLSDDNPYPVGGPEHSETILQSCLAAAEMRNLQFKGVPVIGRSRRPFIPKPQSDKFMERLQASVALDSRTRPEQLGYNGDPSNHRHHQFRMGEYNAGVTYNGVRY
jgi:hypothetical protein